MHAIVTIRTNEKYNIQSAHFTINLCIYEYEIAIVGR